MSGLSPLPPLPSEWVFDASRSPPVYTRPMVGSEIFMQSLSDKSDGAGDGCVGLNFTSSIKTEELRVRARQAVDKLRFICPLISCAIEGDGETLRWVYMPTADREKWLDLAFAHEERGTSLNPSEFMQSVNLRRLPYTDGKGTVTQVRVYLLTTLGKECGLYIHGPHSIIDAGPCLHALNLLCEWISGKGMKVTIASSEEWKNLPADPIIATGGPMKEWGTCGRQLLQYFNQQKEQKTPYITLTPPPRPLNTSDPPLRRTMILSGAETDAIVKQTKKLGVSVTALFYAANALAQYKMNPIADAGNEVYFLMDNVSVSLERHLKPPVNPKTHFVSSSTLIPLGFSMTQPLMEPTERGRLVKTAKAIQEQFDKYMANPCLPQLASVTKAIPPSTGETIRTTKNEWQCRVVNLGPMENKVKMDHGEIVVERVDFGNRRGRLASIHVWTMRSKFHFLVQGAAAWGEEYLKAILDETVRIGSLIVEDDCLAKL